MALPTRILITGAGGQLGQDLAGRLPQATALSKGALSISDVDAVAAALRSSGAELVFNCAAYNAVDQAESLPEVAEQVNAIGPGILAAACRGAGARLVHFSTNFVFSGRDQSPYSETDPADIPELKEEFWANAVRNPFSNPVKQQLTVRLDADVVAWLRRHGKGYQTRLNSVLREEMVAEFRERNTG